jgi:hypothetical protein
MAQLRYKQSVALKCGQCGGKVRRVHRTFVERFSYMAIFECQKCEREEFVPRRFRYHLGPACRCPVCGSFRVTRLKTPDKIDKYHTGFLNLLERIAGHGQLYHCRWCRLQYYDRRPPAREVARMAHGSEQEPVEKTVDHVDADPA